MLGLEPGSLANEIAAWIGLASGGSPADGESNADFVKRLAKVIAGVIEAKYEPLVERNR